MKTKIVSLCMFVCMSVTLFAQKGTETVVLNANVTCEGCKNKIEKNIAYEKGVTSVTADYVKKTVTIVYRTDKTTKEKLSEALTKLGYDNSVANANSKSQCTSGHDHKH